MGWITAISNGLDAILDWFQGNDELEYQKQQDALQNKMSWTGLLTSSTTNINTLLTSIDSALARIDTYQSTIDTGNEWLAGYQSMLDGDRSNTTLGRKLGQYERQGTLLEAAKALREKSAANYLIESAVSKANAYDTAFSDYTSMLKNQSLLNVAAGAKGGKSSAYSMASVIQQQQLRNYVGADMKFDSDTSKAVSPESGSFLNSYIVLNNTIDAQIEENNYAIKAVQNDILNNSNTIKDFYEESETAANQWKADIEDSREATETMESAIERIKNALKLQQTVALEALQQIEADAVSARVMDEYVTERLHARLDKRTGQTVDYETWIKDPDSYESVYDDDSSIRARSQQIYENYKSYLQMKESYEKASKSIEEMEKKEKQRKRDKES